MCWHPASSKSCTYTWVLLVGISPPYIGTLARPNGQPYIVELLCAGHHLTRMVSVFAGVYGRCNICTRRVVDLYWRRHPSSPQQSGIIWRWEAGCNLYHNGNHRVSRCFGSLKIRYRRLVLVQCIFAHSLHCIFTLGGRSTWAETHFLITAQRDHKDVRKVVQGIPRPKISRCLLP